MKKLLSALITSVILFVSIPSLKPQSANAWGTTSVYMTHRECIGTVWVGNTSYLAWNVTFFRETGSKYESWLTNAWTADNEFGNSNRIQNMRYYEYMSLSSSVLNNPNKFIYCYTNK